MQVLRVRRGERVVVPARLRPEALVVLQLLHEQLVARLVSLENLLGFEALS